MTPLQQHCLAVTRRHFFRNCGVGLGKVALAGLLTTCGAVADRHAALDEGCVRAKVGRRARRYAALEPGLATCLAGAIQAVSPRIEKAIPTIEPGSGAGNAGVRPWPVSNCLQSVHQ